VGLALGEVTRILYRGRTNYLISMSGNDKLFLQQRVAQETVISGQDSKPQGLQASHLNCWAFVFDSMAGSVKHAVHRGLRMTLVPLSNLSLQTKEDLFAFVRHIHPSFVRKKLGIF